MLVGYLLCSFATLTTLGVVVSERFTELQTEVVKEGDNCDERAEDGDLLTINYVGRLAADGTQFDSSYERNQPFIFELGKHHVIEGWEKGIQGMCVNEKRILKIPAAMGYGQTGAGDKIPPDSDLIFDVELLKIEDAPPHVNVFKEIDSDKDGLLSRNEVGEYLSKQIPAEMQDHEEVANFDHYKMVDEIFQHEDKDRNGYISHEEFSGPKHDEL